MDEGTDVGPAEAPQTRTADRAPLVEQTSHEYVARWNQLVSTTNCEKGRIICQWREALIESGAPPGSYSDQAWSRRVGGLSPQHAGRLRRVYQRFGEVHREYAGLHWSHFQAACDWPDAEMWLEGAVHNGWPVGEMRERRRQTIGGLPDESPRGEEVAAGELDEDFASADREAVAAAMPGSLDIVHEARPVARHKAEGPPDAAGTMGASQKPGPPADRPIVEAFRPFENFSPLPPDLNRAHRAFAQAIQRHKRSGWRKVALGDVLVVLDSLKQLALAPPED